MRTRDALVDAAVAMFARQGFEDTTVEAIAEEVDVSRRTFHRHFPRKEDVLFADAADRLALFGDALAGRPAEEPVIDSVRVALRGLALVLSARPDVERTRLRLIEASPTLRAHHLRYQDELAAAITAFAAQRTPDRGEPAWPALLGSCSLAVVTTMRRRWTAGELEESLADAIDHGFDVLSHLCEPHLCEPHLGDPHLGDPHPDEENRP